MCGLISSHEGYGRQGMLLRCMRRGLMLLRCVRWGLGCLRSRARTLSQERDKGPGRRPRRSSGVRTHRRGTVPSAPARAGSPRAPAPACPRGRRLSPGNPSLSRKKPFQSVSTRLLTCRVFAYHPLSCLSRPLRYVQASSLPRRLGAHCPAAPLDPQGPPSRTMVLQPGHAHLHHVASW